MKHPVVAVDLGYPAVSEHCFEKKEKLGFLRVLSSEVEKCKGEYGAEGSVFLGRAYGRLVHDAGVGERPRAGRKVLVTLQLP